MKRPISILITLIFALGCARGPTGAQSPGGDPASGYDVRILRDSWGVPHIYGKTDADTAYGLGYAQAEDDFETAQWSLLAARGQLAAVEGLKAAPNDYLVQLLRIWDDVESKYESEVSPGARAVCEGYAAGMNAYAAKHPREVLKGILPVRGQDIVAGFVHKVPLFFGLHNSIGEALGPERKRPVSEKTHASVRHYPLGGIASADAKGDEPVPIGSNAMAVAPSRSADGHTRLAINSHQPWEGPVAWYEAHLHSEEGWNIVGGTFPGGPVILHGHNENLGWAHTVNSPDLVDVYVLKTDPENPYRYELDGEWKDLEVRTAEIKVKLWGPFSWTVDREALWSVHGPVLRSDHGTYAIRYAGMGDVRYLDQVYKMNKAKNQQEWDKAMSMLAMPMFNTVYGDKEGNIAYIYNGALPVRDEGYNWEQYLPGDTSDTLWDEYLAYDALPQVRNPKSGFVINANGSPFFTTAEEENPNPDDFSKTLGIETHSHNRELRLMELYGADDSITAKEFEAYKFDMKYSEDSKVALLVQNILDAPASKSHVLQEAREVLAAWDLSTDPANTSAALGVLTIQPILSGQRFEGKDAAKQEALMRRFREVAMLLKEAYGRVDVPWHKVNRLRHGDTDLGVGGGPFILHAVYGGSPKRGTITGRAGDSYILLVDWDKEGRLTSRSIHQYGSATKDETSPHYADQAELFVKRMLRPVWFEEADIRANLEREYRPGE